MRLSPAFKIAVFVTSFVISVIYFNEWRSPVSQRGAVLPAATAQTGGVFDIWLKARESADAPNDQKVTLYKKSKALVIGNDHYSGGWPQLSNGIKDAEEVAKGLKAQGFEVTLEKDLKSEELDRILKNFFVREGADVDTRLLLWFAGHGYTVRDEGYIVPVDAPSPKADADFREKAISLRRFGEYMREANARHVLAIFDSCFGGTVFDVARSMPPPAITLATTERVREFISSGEAEQQVSDDGTFRKLFLDVLAGKEPDADANHDGYVTGTELGLFLQQKMTNLTNNRQTPRYGKLNALGYDRGDFVFQVGKPDVPITATTPNPSAAEVAQLCQSLANNPSPAVVQSLLETYKGTPIATCARARLEELSKRQAVVQPPVAAPQPPKPIQNTQVPVVAPIAPTPVVAPIASTVSSGSCGSAPFAVSLSSRSAKPLSAAEECALKPKDVFRECENCPDMVVVPAGSFMMGSPPGDGNRRDDEGPQQMVTFAKPFAVGRVHVTVDQYAAFVGETGYYPWNACEKWPGSREHNGSWRDPGFAQEGSHPVVCVSWDDAKAYAEWMSKKTGKPYRLLKEEEFEYAARGRASPGAYSRFWFGDNDRDICRYANSFDQKAQATWTIYQSWRPASLAPCNDGYAYTSPAGRYEPNAFGLYDMAGNAWQWTEDCYTHNYAPAAPSFGSGPSCLHVVRGGYFGDPPAELRAAARHSAGASRPAGYEIGFRVARTLIP
jgi:formylglycine-generating enzyme required for sulfatase activity